MCVCHSDQDGAEPSANSVSASNLLRLSHYTGRQEWLQKSRCLLAAFSDRLTRAPIALPEMVRALMAEHYTLKQVIHPLRFFCEPNRYYITARTESNNTRQLNMGCEKINMPILAFTDTLLLSMNMDWMKNASVWVNWTATAGHSAPEGLCSLTVRALNIFTK